MNNPIEMLYAPVHGVQNRRFSFEQLLQLEGLGYIVSKPDQSTVELVTVQSVEEHYLSFVFREGLLSRGLYTHPNRVSMPLEICEYEPYRTEQAQKLKKLSRRFSRSFRAEPDRVMEASVFDYNENGFLTMYRHLKQYPGEGLFWGGDRTPRELIDRSTELGLMFTWTKKIYKPDSTGNWVLDKPRSILYELPYLEAERRESRIKLD